MGEEGGPKGRKKERAKCICTYESCIHCFGKQDRAMVEKGVGNKCASANRFESKAQVELVDRNGLNFSFTRFSPMGTWPGCLLLGLTASRASWRTMHKADHKQKGKHVHTDWRDSYRYVEYSTRHDATICQFSGWLDVSSLCHAYETKGKGRAWCTHTKKIDPRILQTDPCTNMDGQTRATCSPAHAYYVAAHTHMHAAKPS